MELRALSPDDAPALRRCFRRCYGDTYPAAEFYDLEKLRRRLQDGTLRSVAAVAGSGEVVGHTALSVRHPHAFVAEAGNTVVDPAYRGRGLLRELGLMLAERCRADGFNGFVHYPTTAHEVMQKASVKGGGIETGVMLGYVPATADYRGMDDKRPVGRLAATVVYQAIRPLPNRDVVLVERYSGILKELYAALGAEPVFDTRRRPPRGQFSIRTAHSAGEGIVRHTVAMIGADLGDLIVATSRTHGTLPVTLVDLPLGDPGIDHAVNALTRSGFFYCGLLPGFGAGDVLRLQRLDENASDIARPVLANPGAQRLLAYIDADRVTS